MLRSDLSGRKIGQKLIEHLVGRDQFDPTDLLADRHGSGVVSCDGYCSTCMKLQLDPELEARVADLFERPGMKVVEAEVRDMQIRAGALSYARRFGISRYADLVALGATEVAEAR